TLNPAYSGWERDLKDCADAGFRAIRLYPYYHDYALDGPEAAAVADAAREAGLPVSIPCRVVDVRQRHWMDVCHGAEPEAVLALAERHPGATFVLTEAIPGWPADSECWRRMRDLPFYVEMSRMTSVLGKNLQGALTALGPGRILFGTGFPFKAPSPAFLKIQVLDADDEAKAQITGKNAAQLFGG
ncbi:MAG: amidohydrolase family protein, partial [Candidatus Hydrogenedentes bacterium]|nr:amidohydrolase family protein [Candidatus Hydrogenedentota bacterium]